jgi:hypothetical protein
MVIQWLTVKPYTHPEETNIQNTKRSINEKLAVYDIGQFEQWMDEYLRDGFKYSQ